MTIAHYTNGQRPKNKNCEKLTLAERLQIVREAFGFGGHRQQSAFARKLGIGHTSLNQLESGASKRLGRSIEAYLRIGANPEFLLFGKGPPVLRDSPLSKIVVKMAQLSDDQLASIAHSVDTFVKANAEPTILHPHAHSKPAKRRAKRVVR